MGAFSIWHIVILGVFAMVLFGGRGKVSDLMGDFGKGIKRFKAGLNEPDTPEARGINAHAHVAPPEQASAQKNAV